MQTITLSLAKASMFTLNRQTWCVRPISRDFVLFLPNHSELLGKFCDIRVSHWKNIIFISL